MIVTTATIGTSRRACGVDLVSRVAMVQHLALSMVRVEQEDGIATLVLDRPAHVNVISPAAVQQLHWAFDEACDDSQVEAIVIAADGKVFSLGADIHFLIRHLEKRDFERIMGVTYAGHALFNAIANSPKPVTARVHAAAFGAGVELALSCHRIVAAPGASFCLPELGLGIFPCLGGTQRAARTIGPGLAKWFIYTGKTLNAADALKIGLVDDVAPLNQLEEVSLGHARGELPSKRPTVLPIEFARLATFFDTNRADDLRAGTVDTGGDPALTRAMKAVAGKAPIALRYVEQLIDDGPSMPLEQGLQMEIDLASEIYHTSDAYRGLIYRTKKQIGAAEFEGK